MHAKKTTSSAAECISSFVFWTDKHGEKLDKLWKRVPEHLGQLIATLAMFILGLTVRGQLAIFDLQKLLFNLFENFTYVFYRGMAFICCLFR